MVVRVCTITEPLSCVEVDSLVIIVGGGVDDNWLGGGVGALESGNMVVHEEPNSMLVIILVISTVTVNGTCTVAVPPKQ